MELRCDTGVKAIVLVEAIFLATITLVHNQPYRRNLRLPSRLQSYLRFKSTRGRAVVAHGVPTHRRLGGKYCSWSLGLRLGRNVRLQALRWLLPGERRQCENASTLVLYLTIEVEG